MPYTDAEKKRDRMRDWRKERTQGYHRWLYARRMLHKEIAAEFESSLLLIRSTSIDPQLEATKALSWAQLRREEVGNRFDHEKDAPYWKE